MVTLVAIATGLHLARLLWLIWREAAVTPAWRPCLVCGSSGADAGFVNAGELHPPHVCPEESDA